MPKLRKVKILEKKIVYFEIKTIQGITDSGMADISFFRARLVRCQIIYFKFQGAWFFEMAGSKSLWIKHCIIHFESKYFGWYGTC